VRALVLLLRLLVRNQPQQSNSHDRWARDSCVLSRQEAEEGATMKINVTRKLEFRDPTLIRKNGEQGEIGATGSPVRRGHVPRWLTARLRPHRLDLGCYTPAHPLFGGCAGWLDHWGTTEKDEFVSEPYHVGMAEMRSIINFAELLALDVRVRAASAHFPTETVRIMFTPKEMKP
jgi:hypothetical protein